MASITLRKHRDGTRAFFVRATVNGVTFRKTLSAKSGFLIPDTWSDKRALKEAEKAAALFELECQRGTVSKDKRSFAEYARYVLELKEANKALKGSTLNEYRLIAERLQGSRLGAMRICDIKARDLNALYLELASSGANKHTGGALSGGTIRKYHAFISSVLHNAVKEQIININIAENATLPKAAAVEANYFDADKLAAILDAARLEPVFWCAMIYLFIGTGARRGEISGLRWSDIDFQNGRISIMRNVIRTGGGYVEDTPKTGVGRVVSVPQAVLDMLEVWKTEQASSFGGFFPSGYVFANREPLRFFRPDNITQYFHRFGVRYKLGRVNPHAFRHTQASLLLRGGGDILMTSRRLGHSRTSTTLDIYGHLLEQNDKAAAEKVGSIFGK